MWSFKGSFFSISYSLTWRVSSFFFFFHFPLLFHSRLYFIIFLLKRFRMCPESVRGSYPIFFFFFKQGILIEILHPLENPLHKLFLCQFFIYKCILTSKNWASNNKKVDCYFRGIYWPFYSINSSNELEFFTPTNYMFEFEKLDLFLCFIWVNTDDEAPWLTQVRDEHLCSTCCTHARSLLTPYKKKKKKIPLASRNLFLINSFLSLILYILLRALLIH